MEAIQFNKCGEADLHMFVWSSNLWSYVESFIHLRVLSFIHEDNDIEVVESQPHRPSVARFGTWMSQIHQNSRLCVYQD
ncbi:hypothetical protein ZOSMA_175G00440 [Zostera marina]|uniref:Uncharacterized protein n=1 Tax=Zostera marina TaxID=29655 RepID=A0A0K9PS46_ZOSMR|nr:hypothetical protein ZOSMA_175G00440 [Zostera marina]